MKKKLRVASFFSGIGGIDLGFEKAGAEVVFQCEILPFSQKILKKHWPNVPLASDIEEVRPEDIPVADIFVGGFPCQDLSLGNQGKRKGLKGERSGLFYRYAELIKAKKPRWVFIENVPGMLNSADGDDFRIITQTLDELGYCVSWRVLDAKFFGTPQRRRRTYVVASLGTIGSAYVLFEAGGDPVIDLQSRKPRNFIARGDDESLPEADLFSIQHAGINRKPTAGPQGKGYRNDGETYTLDSRGGADAVCKTNDTFRIREASGISRRVDSYRYRALGNAVAIPVITWIATRIIEADQKYYSD